MSLLKILKNLVTYKEPKDTEGFEFIEDENEYAGNEKQYETVQKKDKSEVEKNPGTKKTPLDIDEWNEIREKKADDKELFDADTVALNLTLNIEQMKKEFNIPKNLDAIIREFKVARNIDALILYIEGMTDKNTINDFILRPLMDSDHFEHLKEGCINDYIIDNVLSIKRLMQIANGKFSMGSFTIPDPRNPSLIIPFDVRKAKEPKVTMKFDKDKPIINLEIKLEGDLLSVQSMLVIIFPMISMLIKQ